MEEAGLKITRVNENVLLLNYYGPEKYVDEMQPLFMTVKDILSGQFEELSVCLHRFKDHIIMAVISDEQLLNRIQKSFGKIIEDTMRDAGFTEEEIKKYKSQLGSFFDSIKK